MQRAGGSGVVCQAARHLQCLGGRHSPTGTGEMELVLCEWVDASNAVMAMVAASPCLLAGRVL